MPVQKIPIANFIELVPNSLLLDVRSPSEYGQAHMPKAINLPLFTDEQRAAIGTAYKQQSREIAIKLGLDYFGVNMRLLIEKVEDLIKSNAANKTSKNIVLHCWRGGMRSAAVAWLLDLYGFKVYQLQGGYKAYRNWVLTQFTLPYSFTIIGGYTGSAKTILLQKLQTIGHSIVDIEALANHKGSALGGIGLPAQPKQEMFENLLAEALNNIGTKNKIIVEDESQRIGNLQIPMPLWYNMRASKVLFLEIPFIQRLQYLTIEYGSLNTDELQAAILRISKRLGGLETKNAIHFLQQNNIEACFKILLAYYDKWYKKGLYNRDNVQEQIINVPAPTTNVTENISLIKSYL